MSVLFYHRVADRIANPWTIDCRQFERQIDYCREHFEMISLAEIQNRIESQHSPRPTVTITFDDGYAENCEFALPLLVRLGIPCTYFVTTQNVLQNRPFAHDVRRGHPLAINTIDQIRWAADAGIEIGLHTASHVDFSAVGSVAELRREIIDAKAELETMIGRPVARLAIPFGMPPQMRPSVFATARAAGLVGVCSAFGGYNQIDHDPFHVRRFHGDANLTRLKNWLSYDLRHVADVALPTEDPLLAELRRERLLSPSNDQAESLVS